MPWWIPLIASSCVTVIASIVGVVALGSSLSKQNWSEVTGTVIGVNRCSGSGSATYSAIVEYEVDGQIYQYIGSSCNSMKPTIGNDLRVVYDPENPSQGANGTFLGLWLVPIIAIGLAIISLGAAIFVIVRRKKSNNSSNPSGQSMDTGNGATSGGIGMVSSQPASTYGQTSSSTYPAATGSSTFANSLGADTPAASAPTSGYNTSTSSGAPASTQNNNSGGKPSLFDQMASGV